MYVIGPDSLQRPSRGPSTAPPPAAHARAFAAPFLVHKLAALAVDLAGARLALAALRAIAWLYNRNRRLVMSRMNEKMTADEFKAELSLLVSKACSAGLGCEIPDELLAR